MFEWLFLHAPVAALMLSLLALVVSAFSLGWNIYRDIILKPKVKVEFGLRTTYGTASDGSLVRSGPPFILLSGINHGPGEVVCTGAVMRRFSFVRSLFQEFPYGFLMVDHGHEYCSALSKRLAVGEEVKIVFPHAPHTFLGNNPSRVGIKDSFGRTHWARRKDLRRACRQHKKDFGTSDDDIHDKTAAPK
jgi:hypothetical protein